MGFKIASFIAPFALLAAVTATAAQPATKPANDLVIDLQTVTCAQYFNAQKHAVPGKNATKEQAATAITAQDDLILAMMWVNGYLTGRDGAKATHTFNHDWIVSHMGKLNAICKANSGAMLLSAAAAKL